MSKSTTDIIAILSIELPFWIPIESGDYTLNNKRILKLHNGGPVGQRDEGTRGEMEV